MHERGVLPGGFGDILVSWVRFGAFGWAWVRTRCGWVCYLEFYLSEMRFYGLGGGWVSVCGCLGGFG